MASVEQGARHAPRRASVQAHPPSGRFWTTEQWVNGWRDGFFARQLRRAGFALPSLFPSLCLSYSPSFPLPLCIPISCPYSHRPTPCLQLGRCRAATALLGGICHASSHPGRPYTAVRFEWIRTNSITTTLPPSYRPSDLEVSFGCPGPFRLTPLLALFLPALPQRDSLHVGSFIRFWLDLSLPLRCGVWVSHSPNMSGDVVNDPPQLHSTGSVPAICKSTTIIRPRPRMCRSKCAHTGIPAYR